MVYYIVACNKEDLREDQVEQLITSNVLKDGNRVLGKMWPLGNK